MSAILAPYAIFQLLTLKDFPEIPEPEETGDTFASNAELKARYYQGMTGMPTLADDSGLCVDALNGRPGVFSSRYGSDDEARMGRLLLELEQVPAPRTAHFACAIAFLVDPTTLYSNEGKLEGEILFEKTGTGGFGYDPIFGVSQGYGTSLAQLTSQEKNAISHRSRALAGILPHIVNWARSLNEPLPQ